MSWEVYLKYIWCESNFVNVTWAILEINKVNKKSKTANVDNVCFNSRIGNRKKWRKEPPPKRKREKWKKAEKQKRSFTFVSEIN